MEQFEEKYQLLKQFYIERVSNDVLIKIGQTTAILFVVIVSQFILHSIVTTIDSIPVINGLLQIIGLYTFIVFSKDNLVTAEQRSNLITNVKGNFNSIVNQEDAE